MRRLWRGCIAFALWLRRVNSGAGSPTLRVILATCDFPTCRATGAAARVAATRSPRAIVCFIENLPCDPGYRWRQESTPRYPSNTAGTRKIFHGRCSRGIDGKAEKGGLLVKAGQRRGSTSRESRPTGRDSLFQLLYAEGRRRERREE